MKLANKSFGPPYQCQKDWPEDCNVQCGEKGLVIKGKESYNTAFFESFPSNPSTFIRGEGNSLEQAEDSAWLKYQNILSCKEHVYKRHGEEHGVCEKCGLFTSHCFPPEHKCSVCEKENVNYNAANKGKLCRDHFLTENQSLKEIDIESNDKLDYMERKKLEFALEKVLFTELMLEYNLINTKESEYSESNRVDKLRSEFNVFSHNELLSVLTHYNNQSNPEENLNFKMIEFGIVNNEIIFNYELYEMIFKKYMKIDVENNYSVRIEKYLKMKHKL